MYKLIFIFSFLSGTLFGFKSQADEYSKLKEWLYKTPEGKECTQDKEFWGDRKLVEKYSIKYKNDYSGEYDTYVFYSVLCMGGAYNMVNMFVEESKETVSKYRVINFAEPVIDYTFIKKYSKKLKEKVDHVKKWKLLGFSTKNMLVNSVYEAKTKAIGTFNKGRGLGDANSYSLYKFNKGKWLLVKAADDSTYDGKVNPILIFEAK